MEINSWEFVLLALRFFLWTVMIFGNIIGGVLVLVSAADYAGRWERTTYWTEGHKKKVIWALIVTLGVLMILFGLSIGIAMLAMTENERA